MSHVYDVEVEVSARYTLTFEANNERDALKYAEEWEPAEGHANLDFEHLEEVTFRQVKADTIKRISDPSELEMAIEEIAGLPLAHTPAGSFLDEESIRKVLCKYIDDEK